MKYCLACKQSKPLSEFYKNKAQKSGLHCWCKPCSLLSSRMSYQKHKESRNKSVKIWQKNNVERVKENQKIWRKSNPEKVLAQALKTNYKISLEDYIEMLVNQNNLCEICKIELKKPFVDHCHNTGKVRSLLCRHCNTMLGMAKESVQTLENAVQYLNQHSIKEI